MRTDTHAAGEVDVAEEEGGIGATDVDALPLDDEGVVAGADAAVDDDGGTGEDRRAERDGVGMGVPDDGAAGVDTLPREAVARLDGWVRRGEGCGVGVRVDVGNG